MWAENVCVWFESVTARASMLLMHQLKTGFTYSQLRGDIMISAIECRAKVKEK